MADRSREWDSPAPSSGESQAGIAKPLLRGWFHAAAALGAIVVTVALAQRTAGDLPRLLSMLTFGASMVELYTVSAIYHIGPWTGRRRNVLRALDHANIFVLIAGTYTPICVNVLDGWLRLTVLGLIWTLALAGVGSAVFTLRLPRWAVAALYVGMGWVALIPLPSLLRLLPLTAVALLFLGGILYTLGGGIYARRWPNPLPRVLGFHEVFHLFTIAANAAFVATIWLWVVAYPRS